MARRKSRTEGAFETTLAKNLRSDERHQLNVRGWGSVTSSKYKENHKGKTIVAPLKTKENEKM